MLDQPPDRIEGVVRARRPKRLPVVLTVDEVSVGPFNATQSGVQEGVTFGETAFGEIDLLHFAIVLRAGGWTNLSSEWLA